MCGPCKFNLIFALLSIRPDSGKLFCYGLFDYSKIKKHKKPLGPRQISERQTVRVAKCGSTFTTFVNGKSTEVVMLLSSLLIYVLCFPRCGVLADRNETFLIGRFNGVDYTKLTKLNTTALKDAIYTLYVSRDDEIFLISGSGDVFKSTNEGDIHFERIILFNDNAVVRKFCSGNGFVCVLTGKLATAVGRLGPWLCARSNRRVKHATKLNAFSDFEQIKINW